MTAKYKALAIYYAMLNSNKVSGLADIDLAKANALIAVNEINNILWNLDPKVKEKLWLYREMEAVVPYWQDVKTELLKL